MGDEPMSVIRYVVSRLNSFASRKFALSIAVIVLATLLLVSSRIGESAWMVVTAAALVSYMFGNAIAKIVTRVAAAMGDRFQK